MMLTPQCDLDTYFVAFPYDRMQLKAMVYVVFGLETLQTIMITKDTFDAYALRLGELDDVRLSWLTAPIMGGLGKFQA
jgi:hypothetical protein